MRRLMDPSGKPATPTLHFVAMCDEDIPAVVAIETAVTHFPWTTGNFRDALGSGYTAMLLRDDTHNLLGYYIVMPVLDEAQLLNVAVALDYQRLGYGACLLQHLLAHCPQPRVVLEVRLSHQRAISLYQRFGFTQIGRRKNYYPALGGGREDALIMETRIIGKQ